jgi:hypothetical protein
MVRLGSAARQDVDGYAQAASCLAGVYPQRGGVYARGVPQGDAGSVPFLAAASGRDARAGGFMLMCPGGAFWIRSAQKGAWENKLEKGFNTTDVPLEFCLLVAEVGEANPCSPICSAS